MGASLPYATLLARHTVQSARRGLKNKPSDGVAARAERRFRYRHGSTGVRTFRTIEKGETLCREIKNNVVTCGVYVLAV